MEKKIQEKIIMEISGTQKDMKVNERSENQKYFLMLKTTVFEF